MHCKIFTPSHFPSFASVQTVVKKKHTKNNKGQHDNFDKYFIATGLFFFLRNLSLTVTDWMSKRDVIWQSKNEKQLKDFFLLLLLAKGST